MNKHQIMFLIFIIILNIITLSCKKPTEPLSKAKLTLKLEDVSCTEAWIKLTTTDIQLPTSVILKQNEINRVTINLTTADTLLYIDSLLPKQTYVFQVISSQSPESSNKLNAITMDTTSHNFTWQTFTFGQHSSSALYDVAIINENNIWAVGEIYMRDSLGRPDPNAYNAVHWNGSEWKLKKIGGQGGWACRSVFAFSENDVWFEGMIKWDGEKYTVHKNGWPLLPNGDGWQVNKMWGSSSNDLYAVGDRGNIAHWDGVRWRKIESPIGTGGTDIGLADIYGNENNELYICGGNLSTGKGIVLKINSNKTVTKIIDSYHYGTGFDSTKMFSENLYGPLVGIWVSKKGTTYTLGNLIYRYNLRKWDYAKGIEYNNLNAGYFSGRGFSWSIRGKDNNDFIFVGEKNTLRYFNGIRAVQIGEPFSYTSEYHWYKVDYKHNTAVAVGRKRGVASVIVFKK